MQRIDRAENDAKIDQAITRLRSVIKQGDTELAQYRDRNPYDTFGLMQAAAAWQHKRHNLASDLASLERERRATQVDKEWRPAGLGFTGSQY